MATAKKGLLTVPLHVSYCRHLRKWGKRLFWHRERKAVKKFIKTETER